MFVIYIEEYGYYEGEIYRNDGETYPSAELQTDDSPFIKKYKTKYLAEKAAKSIVDNCTYIQDWQVSIIQLEKKGEKDVEIQRE